MSREKPAVEPVAVGTSSKRWLAIRLAAVAAGTLLVTVLHFVIDPNHFVTHNLLQRLYYVPILLASIWFGVGGGLLTAVACGAGYAPHILMHWTRSPAYQTSQVVELAMFLVLAVLAGVLADRERSLRHNAEATADERDTALRELVATVETLRRADRLASLGTMAAGMAHELRNPLGALGGTLEILERDFPPDHPRREFYDILRREIGRLNATAGKYLDFARPDTPELREVDLGEAISEAVELLRRTAARTGVRFETRLAPGLPKPLADKSQLQQVLVNVFLNAVQAMPHGGLVEVEAGAVGGSLYVRVRDHGKGLPEVPVERLFEPLFTTKPGGSGLGLAVSRRIVSGHGGRIDAGNAEGGGAVFTLTLVPAERIAH